MTKKFNIHFFVAISPKTGEYSILGWGDAEGPGDEDEVTEAVQAGMEHLEDLTIIEAEMELSHDQIGSDLHPLSPETIEA